MEESLPMDDDSTLEGGRKAYDEDTVFLEAISDSCHCCAALDVHRIDGGAAAALSDFQNY